MSIQPLGPLALTASPARMAPVHAPSAPAAVAEPQVAHDLAQVTFGGADAEMLVAAAPAAPPDAPAPSPAAPAAERPTAGSFQGVALQFSSDLGTLTIAMDEPGGWLASSPTTGVLGLTPPALEPLDQGLERHWKFLYDRVDPDKPVTEPAKVEFSLRRTEINANGIQAGLERLRERGHEKGQGKVAVFGGGYEVDLGPLLDEFSEVHVVDLCQAPLDLAARKYEDHPHKDRLRLVQADLSGIDPGYQAAEMQRLETDRRQGRPRDEEGVKAWFGGLADLNPLPFMSGEFQMVVSPVLSESLPYGPLVGDIEARRSQDEAQGREAPRQAVDSVMGEKFFYDPRVRDGFAKLLVHHSEEMNRMLGDGGVAVFSTWKRPDEHQATLAPDEPRQLFRVGDNRVDAQTLDRVWQPWSGQELLGQTKVYGEQTKPTLNMFLLDR